MSKLMDSSQIESSIDKSFCAAKWLQVTIDLERGTTQSCHHPNRHKIPLDELNKSESALHNTEYKKIQRKMMLSGERPPECEYCWFVEDHSGSDYSDRHIKNSDSWATPYIDQIKKMDWKEDVDPTYVEIMLDSVCNLSCAYCFADISTSIFNEMAKFGKIPLLRQYDHRSSRFEKDASLDLYFQKFRSWVPKVLPNLHVLRITGGEPVLSHKLDEVLGLIRTGGSLKLELSINSNLSYRKEKLLTLVSKVYELKEEQKIKSFDFYVSLDTLTDQASYIRSGLNLNQFYDNLKHVLDSGVIDQVVIMCTFNILSIPRFHLYLEWIVGLKLQYGAKIVLDVSLLKDPIYLSPLIADDAIKEIAFEHYRWMINSQAFSEHELKKLERIVGVLKLKIDVDYLNYARAQFFLFISEFDRRKKANFCEQFPEMNEFYQVCRKASIFESRISSMDY